MKTITFTEFRKRVCGFISEVERGQTLVLLRRGRPVAKVVPFADVAGPAPSWKQPFRRLRIPGSALSSAILDERQTDS